MLALKWHLSLFKGIGDTLEGKEMKQRWKMERTRRVPARNGKAQPRHGSALATGGMGMLSAPPTCAWKLSPSSSYLAFLSHYKVHT